MSGDPCAVELPPENPDRWDQDCAPRVPPAPTIEPERDEPSLA